ncbi:WD repeat-containing protein 3-like [Nematolebias whitei]|uniref:WD repeat-containing protein 3-like n=1 Tax=Nematolebias whitei TaxID=451745 RepID=UPI00189ABAB2|nr:WD repeat-containing protein 3-like [Nematolebias whitei]
MVDHRSEVWGMLLLNQENRLLTGSADSELRAWDMSFLEEEKAEGEPKVKKEKILLDDNDDGEEDHEKGDEDERLEERILSCKKAGSILRETRDRVVSLTSDSKAQVLACHVSVKC